MGPARFLIAVLAAAWPCRAAVYTISSADPDASIQSALASGNAGDTLRFPPGRYAISKTISPKTKMLLMGDSAALAVLAWRGGTAPMVSLNGVDGVEARHLAFEGGTARNAIAAFGATGLRLHHLRVSGFTDTTGMIVGIHFTGKVLSSVIADNVFSDMAVKAEFGGAIRLSAGCRYNRIQRNAVDRAGRGGIHLDASPGNVIQDNRINGSGLAKGGTNDGLGLEVWGGCDSSLIEGNVVDHWLSVDGSPFTAVRRNRVGTSDGTYEWAGLELVSSSHCVFTGNSVDDGAHIGISASNTPAKDEVYWAFNSIRKASTWAAQLQGESGGASYHFFYGNTFAGTPADHPRALYPRQGHALRLNGECRHFAFDSNAVVGNGGAVLDLHGALDDLSFTRNRAAGNGRLLNGTFGGGVLRWTGNSIEPAAEEPASQGSSPVPECLFEAPASARAGEAVAFSNRSRAGTGARYLWDFDEGLPSNAVNPSHRFDADGLYRVTLVAWEENGQGCRCDRWIAIGTGADVRRPGARVPRAVAPAPVARDILGRRNAERAMSARVISVAPKR